MRTAICLTTLVAVLAVDVRPGMAQDGNVPPEITGTNWFVRRNLDGRIDTAYDGSLDGYAQTLVPFVPDVDRANEFDILVAEIDIMDPDFVDENGDPTDEEVFVAVNGHFTPLPGYGTPVGPPITTSTSAFVGGFGSAGGTTTTVRWAMIVPGFVGKNQARLRGLIDWDVRYTIVFAVSNEEDPASWTPGADGNPGACGRFVFAEDSVTHVACDLLYCLENPAADPPNPPAFADAGANVTVVAGSTVELDGAGTFDGFNVGFDVGNPNIFEKDRITYIWEFISGPESVTPIYRDVENNPAVAEVTLNELGMYVYRLTVDDGVNALPTSDVVTIEVVAQIPDNRAPIASAVGPTAVVTVGSILSLDGTSSFDPDGDPLNFRWQQTDEIGGQISPDDIGRVFQPLGGLETAISRWQAVKAGTFYFRLLVDDGQLVGTDRISVEVVEPGTAGIAATNSGASSAERNNAAGGGTGDQAQPANQPVPTCGSGLLPLGMVPLALCFMRGRQRRTRD